MSNFWWLQPGWTQARCSCGVNIWDAGGDPDHGLCPACWDANYYRQQHEKEQREEYDRAMNEAYGANCEEQYEAYMREQKAEADANNEAYRRGEIR